VEGLALAESCSAAELKRRKEKEEERKEERKEEKKR